MILAMLDHVCSLLTVQAQLWEIIQLRAYFLSAILANKSLCKTLATRAYNLIGVTVIRESSKNLFPS